MKMKSKLCGVLIIGFLFSDGFLMANAETLTGIVKQPEPPYSPAASSTVTVYDKRTKNKIVGPDTTDANGRYRYDQIRKGQSVIITASWRAEVSSPGVAETEVIRNPTEADVQLLPAKTASAEKWILAGRQFSTEKKGNALELFQALPETDVPSESIYRFILGIHKESPSAYKDLNKISLFKTSSPDKIADALKSTEHEYKSKTTVPTYEQLQSTTKGLTPQEYFEVLGFIGSSTASRDADKWDTAIKRLPGEQKQEKVRQESNKISAALSKPTG